MWSVLQRVTQSVALTEGQKLALTGLEAIVSEFEQDPTREAQLDFDSTGECITFTLFETSGGHPVVNGVWLRLSIEEDGYTVMSSSESKHAIAGWPGNACYKQTGVL